MAQHALAGAKELRFLSKFNSLVALLLGLLLYSVSSRAEIPKGLQFKADFYQRDLTANTLRGKGNAWVKSGEQEVFADEIEVDFATNRALARGHVRIIDEPLQISCVHAQFNLKGNDGIFDKAVITSGQMIVTGEVIRRINATQFEVEEASYSNCNTDLIKPPQAGTCPQDWKFSGRRFFITLGEYAHFHDVLVSAKSIPIFFLPYLMIPVKTERQTGFLMPALRWSATLGNGIEWPFFWAMNEWQDLLIRPTYYSSAGMHLGLSYKYAYSSRKYGHLNLYMVDRRFSGADNPLPDDTARSRWLGVIGEGAVEAANFYQWEASRAKSLQVLNFVSNPYYTFDYFADVGPRADLGSLRSQLAVTLPTDEWLFTAQAQYLQSLTMSVPNSNGLNTDLGGVAQLPILTVSKTTTPFWDQFLSYEVDTQFSNFTRNTPTDTLLPGSIPTTVPALTGNLDYIRTGKRIQLEPRLVMNVPMPSGFQFQPLLRTGALLYQFDAPAPAARHREYIELEIPVALQLSRVFTTTIPGFEKISHIFQPRFVYASSLAQTGGNDHDFFFEDDSRGLFNPRFDILDQFTPYEYMRFELINRFLRKTGDSAERFFWFQVSEQYNLRTSSKDPRYSTALGPIEVFSSLGLGRYSMQVTASFPLQETTTLLGLPVTPVRESTVSTGISYSSGGKNQISLNGLYRVRADPDQNQQMVNLYMYQELPTFFDLEGAVEYNFITRRIYGYKVGFHFRSKPRSCWSLGITAGQTSYGNPFTNFDFKLGAF